MKILLLPHFKKQFKQYIKKHQGLKDDLIATCHHFDLRQSVSLGRQLYKIRMRSKETNVGKSGGFRVIVFYHHKTLLLPITIFAKSEQETISTKQLNDHLQVILKEFQEYQ